jgi:prolyl oligopeptidase
VKKGVITVVVVAALSFLVLASEEADPHMWLEEVDGARALAWVKERSQRTTSELEQVKEFKPILERTTRILDSKERIPNPDVLKDTVYNFWQDETNPRGIWRRTSLSSYRTAEPKWETVIDVDAIGKTENVPWVWKGADCFPPEYRLCMVSLSRGGSDAAIYKEFDTSTKKFVEGGFSLPEAKSSLSWRDEDTLWVGTDFGEGSLTTSGYARIVKLWKRGTPVSSAKTIFEGQAGDVGSFGSSVHTPDRRYDVVARIPAFFRHETYLLVDDRLARLDVPEDSNIEGYFKGRLMLSLRTDWTVGGKTFRSGSLLGIGVDEHLKGGRGFDVLFEPAERISLQNVYTTRDQVVLNVLDNVRGKLLVLTPNGAGWERSEVSLPGLGAVQIADVTSYRSDWLYYYSDFLSPSTLYRSENGKSEKLKTAPRFFSEEGMKVAQREATSKDGTRIPYFLVTPKGFKADGNTPTLLFGYGGFEVPERPTYSGTIGSSWLERGGVYVVANIRGGGEFGPSWHLAATKQNHIRNFQDFIAVAEDLIATKVTSPKHLGIRGGSQGGLLVGGTFTLRPDLFGAVVAQIPLADMRRYNKLLAGASWMSEYGNPDVPEEWAYIKTWSPYELLRKDATYPKVFYWTTTRDDRVHPAHARKMVAKMEEMGHPVYYFENVEGGHGSGSINRQKAYTQALEYAYLWKTLR